MHGTTIRLGGYQGPASVHTGGLATFAEHLTSAVGGDVSIDRVDDVTARGDTARSLFDGLESGAFQVGYINSGYLAARVPALGVADLPFAVTDRTTVFSALDGIAGDMLRAAVGSAMDLKVLGFWDNGFRHVTNRARPIRTIADCRGLVVRTLDNAVYQEVMAAMGFTPKVTDVRELREAVANGQVDAQENPLSNTVNFGLHHHHPHVSLTGHLFSFVLFTCNAAWFRALPAHLREAVIAAADAASAEQRRRAAQEDAQALDVLRGHGITPVMPADIDLAGFRDACRPIFTRQSERLGPKLVSAYLGT